MPHVSFLAECGNPGTDGTTIDLAGLGLPDRPFTLFTDFDVSKAVAKCVVSKVPAGLLVEADVPEALMDCYPAIGFQVLEATDNEHGGRTITKCQLKAVSLSAKPNADSLIARLSEQQIRDAPKLLDQLKQQSPA
jgi:hypothetical protein